MWSRFWQQFFRRVDNSYTSHPSRKIGGFNLTTGIQMAVNGTLVKVKIGATSTSNNSFDFSKSAEGLEFQGIWKKIICQIHEIGNVSMGRFNRYWSKVLQNLYWRKNTSFNFGKLAWLLVASTQRGQRDNLTIDANGSKAELRYPSITIWLRNRQFFPFSLF